MSQYTLYVHSWDIGSGTRGGNHTGFTLEETTENGSSTRTIDLSKDKITGNIITPEPAEILPSAEFPC